MVLLFLHISILVLLLQEGLNLLPFPLGTQMSPINNRQYGSLAVWLPYCSSVSNGSARLSRLSAGKNSVE